MTTALDVFIKVGAQQGFSESEVRARVTLGAAQEPPGWLRYISSKQLTDNEVTEFEQQLAGFFANKGVKGALGPFSKDSGDADGASARAARQIIANKQDLGQRDPLELLRGSGAFWWSITYAETADDLEASDLATSNLEKIAQSDPDRAQALAQAITCEQTAMLVMGAARWADQAFPLIRLAGHRYTAALAATTINDDIDVRPPWKAFMIALPSGMFSTTNGNGEQVEISCILVDTIDGYLMENLDASRVPTAETERTLLWSITALAKDSSVDLHRWRQRLSQLLESDVPFADDPFNPLDMKVGEQDERTIQVIVRLALNVCLAMSDPRMVRQMGSHPKGWEKGPGREEKFPVYRTYRVGEAIEFDCRKALSDYLSCKTDREVKVQMLVRGHWKRQVHGLGRAERKVIWIMPYWRGNAEAEILVRPHIVGKDVEGEA